MDGRQMVRRPRRTLGALALGLCAVGVAVGSGADFSASSANPDNTFSAGTLSIDNSTEGAAFLTATNLKPGGAAQTGVVDIRNSGSMPGDFTLSRINMSSTHNGADGSPPYTAKVWLTVRDCGGFNGTAPAPCGDANDTVVYNHRSLADMGDPIPVGRLQPGERHRFQFTAELDASATNSYQGDTAKAQFQWNAVQAPGA
jgi:hypothetical protein